MRWKFWERSAEDARANEAVKPVGERSPDPIIEAPRSAAKTQVARALSQTVEGIIDKPMTLEPGGAVSYYFANIPLYGLELKIGNIRAHCSVKEKGITLTAPVTQSQYTLNTNQDYALSLFDSSMNGCVRFTKNENGSISIIVRNFDPNAQISVNIAQPKFVGEDGYWRIPFGVEEEAVKPLVLEPHDCWETNLLYGIYKFGRYAVRSEREGVYVNGEKVNGTVILDGDLKLECKTDVQSPKIWLYNAGHAVVSTNVWARRLEGGRYTQIIDRTPLITGRPIMDVIPSLRSAQFTDDELPPTEPPASQPAPEIVEDPADMSAGNIEVSKGKLLMVLDQLKNDKLKNDKLKNDQVQINPGEVAGLSFPAVNVGGNYMAQLTDKHLMVSVDTDGTAWIDGVQIEASDRFVRRANMEFALRRMPVPGGESRYLLLIRHPKNTIYGQPITIS